MRLSMVTVYFYQINFFRKYEETSLCFAKYFYVHHEYDRFFFTLQFFIIWSFYGFYNWA